MRVAVLGLGSIGSRHARNVLALGHEVLGFDPRPALEDEDWGRADSLEEALAASDAVVVATPTAMHAEHAIAALERGVAALVEKPLAADFPAARRVSATATERGVVCAVAMNLRFHPAIRALRELISDGILGTVRYAHAWAGSDLRTWRPGTDYRASYSAQAALGGGVIRDSIHELDYLTWLLGPAASVIAEVTRASDLEIDVEDLAVGVLRLCNGALASVDLTYVDRVYRRGCLVVGAEATARWDWTIGTVTIERPGAASEVLDVAADVSDTYVAELRDFLNAIETGDPPRTTAEEGAAVVRLADAVAWSAARGERIML